MQNQNSGTQDHDHENRAIPQRKSIKMRKATMSSRKLEVVRGEIHFLFCVSLSLDVLRPSFRVRIRYFVSFAWSAPSYTPCGVSENLLLESKDGLQPGPKPGIFRRIWALQLPKRNLTGNFWRLRYHQVLLNQKFSPSVS